MSPTVHGPGGRAVRLLSAAALVLGAAACSTSHASSGSTPPTLTVEGKQILDPAGLQAAGERELASAVSFGYVSASGAGKPQCWFARVGTDGQVDGRLWCGPVQVPGSPPANAWVPIPMIKTGENASQIQLSVQDPQVPQPGNRSTPVGDELLRADGSTTDPKATVNRTARANFVAVLTDTEHKSNVDLGLTEKVAVRVHDDLLAVNATGYGRPATFPIGGGATLVPDKGVQLRVLRLHVERPGKTDPAFAAQQWSGFAPQQSTLSLVIDGRTTVLSPDRLPDSGDVFVIYTVPDKAGPESLVLSSVGAKSLDQRLEVPGGQRATPPPDALLTPSGVSKAPANASQPITVRTAVPYGGLPAGDHAAQLTVTGVRLGWQRPIKLDSGDYQLVTESAAGKSLLEVAIKTSGQLPAIMAGQVTKNSFTLTLPDGGKAPLVGVRYDGDLLPAALVFEVPAAVKSVKIGVNTGPVQVTALGRVDITAGAAPIDLPLDFG
ncbi:hypothetical protein [Kutzneria buriramensis]|uniref:Uncharacterized protein n=1 Tax=Kutzneria buriramensis TaxID=1045776 RepID=A0A3E0HCJ8_9PSEU|nr:hypothetical protein [Kutzneria buriramensis]REH41970.1 hypothetical protein BCF44_111275 [Kutzneria buriramensis]